MKRQLYPRSLAAGSVLYKCEAYTDDAGKTSIEQEEWVVRSIQRQRRKKRASRLSIEEHRPMTVYLTQRVGNMTWVNGCWARSISSLYKKSFRCGDRLPRGLYTTPLQAIQFAVADKDDEINALRHYRAKETDPAMFSELDTDIANCIKEQRFLKARLTRLKKSSQQ